MSGIAEVAIIGAGVMGSGIAAHLANAGVRVVLLDRETSLADQGVALQVRTHGFLDVAFADRVTTGSLSETMALAAGADWIIEAVVERLDVKRDLYGAIEAVRKPGSIVSSNTSTIPLAALIATLPESFAADFCITHFFNPPRVLPLMELVVGPQTRAEVAATIRDFAATALGKTVVECRDTPGFIANRIGAYWMIVAQNEAIDREIDVEEADRVVGKPFGIPETGIFGLLDLVGVDLMPAILRSLKGLLPQTDALQDWDAEPELVAGMIADNRIGRKSGGGFMRVSADRGRREVIDLKSGRYRPMRNAGTDILAATAGDARALMEHPDRGGRYAAAVMGRTLSYAASLLPEIAESPDVVDDAVRAGYGWKQGPFELIDRLGPAWLVERLGTLALAVPPYLSLAAASGAFYRVVDGTRCCLLPDGSFRPVARPEGVIAIADLKLAGPPVSDYGAAALWDLGDGVACLEFRTKMNTLSEEALDAIGAALRDVERSFEALVIGSDLPVFSAGADLRVFLRTVETGGSTALGPFIDKGQQAFKAIKFAPFPVVGAAAGTAVGGGCELLLHCDAIQAHVDLKIGLVETTIGVIPGWGGCKEMLLRRQAMAAGIGGPLAPAMAAFALIAPGTVAKNAFDARKLGFLRPGDDITTDRRRVLADAKRKALARVGGYRAPDPLPIAPSGGAGAAALRAIVDGDVRAGRATEHDRIVADALIAVLSGGPDADPAKPMSENDVLLLEKQAFLPLFDTAATIDRVAHMLTMRKPLRN